MSMRLLAYILELCFGRTYHFKFPKFNGQDPKDWIAHAEQYFERFDTHEEMKIYKVLASMEGYFLH